MVLCWGMMAEWWWNRRTRVLLLDSVPAASGTAEISGAAAAAVARLGGQPASQTTNKRANESVDRQDKEMTGMQWWSYCDERRFRTHSSISISNANSLSIYLSGVLVTTRSRLYTCRSTPGSLCKEEVVAVVLSLLTTHRRPCRRFLDRTAPPFAAADARLERAYATEAAQCVTAWPCRPFPSCPSWPGQRSRGSRRTRGCTTRHSHELVEIFIDQCKARLRSRSRSRTRQWA